MYFQSLKKGNTFPLITPRRKDAKPHFTKTQRGYSGWLISHRKLVGWVVVSIQLLCPYHDLNIHSFNKYLATSTLLGDGDADENKTNNVKGAYLPVWVCELQSRGNKQIKQVTHWKVFFSGTWVFSDRSLLTFLATSSLLPKHLLYAQHEPSVYYMCSIYWLPGKPYFVPFCTFCPVDSSPNISEKELLLFTHSQSP